MISGGDNGGFLLLRESIMLSMIFGAASYGANLVPIFLCSSIFAGLDLASSLLDVFALYDGTSECMSYLIVFATIKVFLALLPILFPALSILGAAIGILSSLFSEAIIRNINDISPCYVPEPT